MKQTTYEDLAVEILQAVKEKFDMNLSEFCSSELPTELLGEPIKANTLRAYLAPGSSTKSFKPLAKLYSALGLGETNSKTIVTRHTMYYKTNKDEKLEKA